MQVLIVKIADEKYAINIENIEEIMQKEDLTKIPMENKYFEGVIYYRGNVLPVYNLRKILGYKGFEEEQLQLIETVEHQHKAWVEDFQKSIQTGAPFTKTLDPHKCDLGKWIDKTMACLKCNNRGFVNLIKKHLYNEHQKLHLIGADVLKCTNKHNQIERFDKEITKYLGDSLSGLKTLEKNVNLLVNAFERIVIYKKDEQVIGFTIDDAERMFEIEESEFKSSNIKKENKTSIVVNDKAFLFKNEIVPVIDININLLKGENNEEF